MSDAPAPPPKPEANPTAPADTVVRTSTKGGANDASWFAFRRPIPQWAGILLGTLCLAIVLGIWWFLTRGAEEERIIGYSALPSPAETFSPEQIHSLWFDAALTRNLLASLRRVVLGFALATLIAVPLGVLCGCFPWANAFFAPLNAFGRNIPIAALIPLTLFLFGAGEPQKVIFIFVAVAAFIMMDTAAAIADVSDRYIDTAFTLGASRRQIILNVLVPLAMPRIFNSMRLLFGIAFGYIMLIESITIGDSAGGIGHVINVAQRLGRREPIYLILIIIPAVALLIDRMLFMIQRSLFPHQYGGSGMLHILWRGFMHTCEDVKRWVIAPTQLPPGQQAALARSATHKPPTPAPK